MAMRFSFVMKLFALYSPQAAAALTDIDKARLLWEAVREMEEEDEEGCGEIGLDLLLPISTLDQLQAAFEAFEAQEMKGQLRALVEAQCDILEIVVLNQDVMGIVYEYLFGGGAKSEADDAADSEADDFEADDFEADDFEADDFEADDFEADDFEADDFEATGESEVSSDATGRGGGEKIGGSKRLFRMMRNSWHNF